MITKVISGFQTGVDIAGIEAAKAVGFNTGGSIPKGFRTLAGSKPEYARLYGAEQHSSFSYKERTWDNVFNSDATLRIARNYNSAGEKCTTNAIINFSRPHLDLEVSDCPVNKCDKIITYQLLKKEHDVLLYALDWLYVNDVKVLNIAGNSEDTMPGIHDIAYEFLVKLFTKHKEEKRCLNSMSYTTK